MKAFFVWMMMLILLGALAFAIPPPPPVPDIVFGIPASPPDPGENNNPGGGDGDDGRFYQPGGYGGPDDPGLNNQDNPDPGDPGNNNPSPGSAGGESNDLDEFEDETIENEDLSLTEHNETYDMNATEEDPDEQTPLNLFFNKESYLTPLLIIVGLFAGIAMVGYGIYMKYKPKLTADDRAREIKYVKEYFSKNKESFSKDALVKELSKNGYSKGIINQALKEVD